MNNTKRPPKKGPMMTTEKAKDFKGTFKKLIHTLSEYKLALSLVIIFSIVSAAFSIIGPKVLGNATTILFDGLVEKINGTGSIDFNKIGSVLGILLTLYVISAFCSFIQGFIMSKVSNKISYNFRKKISEKINKLPMSYYDSKTTGEILSIITNDVDTLSQSLNQSLTQIISSFITVIGVTFMMISISGIMTLAVLIVLPISLVFIAVIVKNSQKYFEQQQEYLAYINGQVEEVYGGHNIVKAFNSEEKVIKTFSKTNKTLYSSAWKSQFISGLMHPIMQFVSNVGYVIVSMLGGWLVIKDKIAVGDILSFTQYVRNFTQPLGQIAQVGSLLQSTVAAAERVYAFLEETEEVKDVENPIAINNIKGNITFENVNFGYKEDQTIIHNFNIAVKQGEKIAIVGPTGAGKTTIVKLLMRFYDVTNGKILIDGHNIKDLKKSDLRSLFGMVLQDTWLFNGSIKDNIRYGKLDASDEEVQKAAEAAMVDHFVKTLQDGYNMEINEEASNISQGQKQLLTIARVILTNPKILILDEATSSVDTRTEVLIQKAMDMLMEGRTSFIIAHRLSTIKNADKILVMDKGDIIEVGNHEELLAKGGFYANLYNSQFEEIEN